MNISFSETFKKVTSVTLIFGLVFSTLTPAAFAAVVPTFVATETVANVSVGSALETATHTDITANVSEVKATRTVDVQSLPANNSTLSIGTCDITFKNIAGSTADELNCSDDVATIDRNTGSGNNARDASSIAGRIRALTNVGSSNHGTLVVSGSGTDVIFTTSAGFTETTASVIGFSGTAAGVSLVSTNSVTSVIPVKQETSITVGGTIDIGDTFTVTSAPLGTASFTALTTSTSDAATGLNAAIQAHPNYPTRNYTTSVAGNVITLTAKTAGTAFTTLTPTTTNFPGTAQVVTFTPSDVVKGLKFTVNINGNNYEYTTLTGASIPTVTNALTTAITSGVVTCTNHTTHITCTANTPGTALTSYSASVLDVEAPVITLTPGSVSLFVGDLAYDAINDEIGFSATDNVDGDRTANVVVTNNINQSLPGPYTINYNVSDTIGNLTIPGTYTRGVTVSDKTGPTISGTPASFSVPTVGNTTQIVTYTLPTATDDVDPVVTVTCTPNSGTVFPYGVTPVTCSSTDLAGNSSNTTFDVTVEDVIKPTITSSSITSSNINPILAKAGDVITVSFTTSEPVNLPTVTIAGKTATVTNVNAPSNDYTATYTVTALLENQGPASIAIDFSDLAPVQNSAVQVTAVSGTVTIDTVLPIISGLVMNTNNPLSVTASFITDENASSTIQYGPTNAYGTTTTISGALTQNHVITLTSLTQCDVYHYSLTVTDAAGNIYTSPDASFQVNCNVLGGGGGGIGAGPIFVLPTTTNPTPTQPTTPEQATNTAPNPAPTPAQPTPTGTTESTPTSPAETIATEIPVNNTPSVEPAPTPTQPTAPVTDSGTGDTTGGAPAPAFNPADATLDQGGGTTPDNTETVVETPTPETTTDIGGGVAVEESSYTLLWTLLGLIALLNTWWFFVAKNKPDVIRRD